MHAQFVDGEPILGVPTIYPFQYFVRSCVTSWMEKQEAGGISMWQLYHNMPSMMLVAAEDTTLRKMRSWASKVLESAGV